MRLKNGKRMEKNRAKGTKGGVHKVTGRLDSQQEDKMGTTPHWSPISNERFCFLLSFTRVPEKGEEFAAGCSEI